MNLYTLAPKPVIDNLSPQAKSILMKRMHNNTLLPYYSIENKLRIRGLKPSLLYVHYTILRADNTLESIYLADAEELQSTLVQKILDAEKTEVDEKALLEKAWTTWEDAFMSEVHTNPLNESLTYTDLMNNTFVHCIAYACANKEPTDLDNIENQFQIAIHNLNLYKKNNLGQTPLQILVTNPNLIPYVESVLLRLHQHNRLLALDFSNWHNSWGSLLNLIVEQNIHQLISQTVNNEGFLTIYMYLTHNSESALLKLFGASYRLQEKHLVLDKLTLIQKQLISACLFSVPSWSNLTLWMYWIKNSVQLENHYKKLQKYLIARNNLIRLALIRCTLVV